MKCWQVDYGHCEETGGLGLILRKGLRETPSSLSENALLQHRI